MKKIIIADDIPEIRKLVELTLRSNNYQIFQAENGEKTIEIAKNIKPDLIILDVMMPGEFNGIEVTRILKTDLETKDSKIILLTAKDEITEKEEGFNAGADDYFTKPFSPLDLIKKVDEALG